MKHMSRRDLARLAAGLTAARALPPLPLDAHRGVSVLAYVLAGLIAPRSLFAESGERDNIFPVAASRESFDRVREIYRMFGAEPQFDHEIFPDEHAFWGRRGIPFLVRHLTA